MWTPRRRRSEPEQLNRYWNALNRGAPPEELARLAESLDPSLIAAIDRAHALQWRRRPDPAFAARLEHDLMRAFAVASAGSIPPPAPILDPIPEPAAPRARPWLPRLPAAKARRRWAVAQAAAALVILVALVAAWFAFRPRQEHMVVGPNVTATPIPAATLPAVSMFRGDPARTGVMPGPGPEGSPGVLWQYQAAASGRVISSPAIVNGVLYVGSGDYMQPGAVVALDAATGALRWRADLPGEGFSSPAVAGGLVYIASMDNDLYALDAATGAVRWHAPLAVGTDHLSSPVVIGGTVYVSDDSSPAVVDGVLYCGSGASSNVYAFDAATGALRWQTQEPYIGLYALDAATGAVRWKFGTVMGPVRSSPAVANGLVYVGDDGGSLHAVDAATGRERWSQSLGAVNTLIFASPAVADGAVYVGAMTQVAAPYAKSAAGQRLPGEFAAFDAATGKELWRVQAPDGFSSSPAIVDGVVYAGNLDGRLYALDAATGKERWALNLGDAVESSPAVIGGTIYVGTGAANANRPGVIYAIGAVAATPAATP